MTTIQIPEQITNEWIKEALFVGEVKLPSGKIIFIKKMPNPYSFEEYNKHLQEFPLHKDKQEIGYFYHGTKIENLPKIIQSGLLGSPDVATLTSHYNHAAFFKAEDTQSELKKGVITIWKIPVHELVYLKGDRDTEELMAIKGTNSNQIISPKYLLGMYIVDQIRV